MTQMRIQHLLPLLRAGWVACDSLNCWTWFSSRPQILNLDGVKLWVATDVGMVMNLSCGFGIAPYDGDWKDSLMRCGNENEQAKIERLERWLKQKDMK